MGVKPRLRFKPITLPPVVRRSLHAATHRLYCTSVNDALAVAEWNRLLFFEIQPEP